MADAHPIPKNPRFIDLTGQRFARWLVLAYAGGRDWLCQCDCGNQRNVQANNLKQRKSLSCGCHRAEVMAVIKRVHGASNGGGIRQPHDAYNVWIDMRRRCLDPRAQGYKHYGGRGIKICDRWLSGEGGLSAFECFLTDLGARPSRKHTLEREDVNGDYEPSNCRWATHSEQARNKRNNRIVTFGGARMIMQDAIKASGIPEWTVYERIERGWSDERALTQPVLARRWRGPKTRKSK